MALALDVARPVSRRAHPGGPAFVGGRAALGGDRVTSTDQWAGPLAEPVELPGPVPTTESAGDLRRFVVLLAWIPAILLADHGWSGHHVGLTSQRLLGVGTWALLLVMLRGESR